MNNKKKTMLLMIVIVIISLLAVCVNYMYSLSCLTDSLKTNYINGLTELYDPNDKLQGFCAVIFILPLISSTVCFVLLKLKLKIKRAVCFWLSALVLFVCSLLVGLSVMLYTYNYISYCNTVVTASESSWYAEREQKYIQDNSPANEIIVATW